MHNAHTHAHIYRILYLIRVFTTHAASRLRLYTARVVCVRGIYLYIFTIANNTNCL